MAITLWDLYLKTLAELEISYTYPDGRRIVLPEARKPVVAALTALESGWGTNSLVNTASGGGPTYNFFSLKKRDDIYVPFKIEKVWHNGGDGWYWYCDFYSIKQAILAFFAFIHRQPYYAEIDRYLDDDRAFVGYFGPHYCPPGYTSDWIAKNGGNYTDVLCNTLRPKALSQLIAHGYKTEAAPDPTPVEEPAPIPGPIIVPASNYRITNGVLSGPGVQYSWVKNFDNWLRPSTEGFVVHTPGAFSTGKEIIGQGIFDVWNKKGTGKSAHGLIEEDGDVIQAVDLLKPAYHCYGWNTRSVGWELANIGPFYTWQEVGGWFYRFRYALWVQKIRKADLVLCTTAAGEQLYYLPPTSAQIEKLGILYDVHQSAFGKLWIKGHDELNPVADPGPNGLFPWHLFR